MTTPSPERVTVVGTKESRTQYARHKLNSESHGRLKESSALIDNAYHHGILLQSVSFLSTEWARWQARFQVESAVRWTKSWLAMHACKCK